MTSRFGLFFIVMFFAQNAQAVSMRVAILEFQGEGIAIQTLQVFTEEARSGALKGAQRLGDVEVYTQENQAKLIRKLGGCAEEGECDVDTLRNMHLSPNARGNAIALLNHRSQKAEKFLERRLEE